MKRDNEKIVDALNNLIETCKDAQNGFRTAAENVQDPELRQLLNGYAGQRAAFAAELQAEVRRHSGDPEKSGSVVGTLQRGWMNLKAAVAGNSAAAVLGECESAEDAGLKEYEEVSRGDLPLNIKEVVARQYKEIKDARERIRALREAAK